MTATDMSQAQRRLFLIDWLLREEHLDLQGGMEIPDDEPLQKELLRALFNVRPPKPVPTGFLDVQDTYLREEIRRTGITEASSLEAIRPHIFLWRGDITRLACGAIVNAANQDMLGCFVPNHGCIDNAIHTFAGVQLRLECARIMREQGYPEPVGRAKITKAYNLPSRRVLHTVGPTVTGRVTAEHDAMLASCYTSCLELADRKGVDSLAFCCISTGVFRFPGARAARIAVSTVDAYRERTHTRMDVVFNVFTEEDEILYRQVLKGADA